MSNSLNPYVIECVEGASKRTAAAVSGKMRRGVATLATVSSTAAFVGLFGRCWVRLIHFQAAVPTTGMSLTADRLSESLIPTLLGLLVAIQHSGAIGI